MVARYMLDTNTMSDIVRDRSSAARARLDRCEKGEACLSIITLAEALYGLARRPEAYRLKRAVDILIATAQIEPWTEAEAHVYGRLRAGLESTGISIAHFDLLIAAHAISKDLVLVTRDKAFRRIPELQVENWATDLQ